MDYLAKASEIYSNNILEFQKTCGLYKWFLEKNFRKRFCTDGDCRKIFMVEICISNFKWGAFPRMFNSEKEANQEIESLKHKYPFISNFRIVEKKERD